jgi:ribokinase
MKFQSAAFFSLAIFPNESFAHIGIAGSANLDTFLPISHLPQAGENLTLLPNMHPSLDVPGGKGCNQAIAASKLSNQKVSFLGRIGNDSGGEIISKVLNEHQVNIQHLQQCPNFPTGRGYVFLEARTGRVSAVVSGGSNMYGWESFRSKTAKELDVLLEEMLLCENDQVQRSKCLLLQREVPEFVNLMLAERAHHNGITVLQDIGGEDRDMSNEMMSYCDYIMPNLTELRRLVKSFVDTAVEVDPADHDSIIKCAQILQENGARNVLVTLGEKGSLLVMNDGSIIFQEPCKFDQEVQIVDETGAGDCYRAGFAVALSESNGADDVSSIQECMRFASGAGALACLKEGAVPSIPTREEVKAFIENNLAQSVGTTISIPRGGGGNKNFPYMFGSRLNSMKDRPELWSNPVDNVKEWVKRQGAVKGLGCVDFNYPQHFQSWTSKEAKQALDEVRLVAGAVCLRYPAKFARGAMNHPDEALRREAIQLTKEAAVVAKELGCDEVVIWSACKY